MKHFLITGIALLIWSCWSTKEVEKKNIVETDEFGKNSLTTVTQAISTKDIAIPTQWSEVANQGGKWVYWIPCWQESDKRSIEIWKGNPEEAIMWNWGTAGQWFAIRKIQQMNDSLVFTTVLPYDTVGNVVFTFRYVDKVRKIAQWKVYDNNYQNSYYCVPTSDTIKYERVVEACKEEVKE